MAWSTPGSSTDEASLAEAWLALPLFKGGVAVSRAVPPTGAAFLAQGLTPVETPWRVFWRRLRRNRPAVVAACVLLLMVGLALGAPWLANHDRDKPILFDRLLPPGAMGRDGQPYYLGTDDLGRDQWTRLLYGGRISLSVAFVSVAVSISIGVTMGALSGYYGGLIDNAIMRLGDLMLSIPRLVLIITILAVMGQDKTPEQRIYLVILVLGLTSWPATARLVRGEFLSLRERDFVEAARAMGAPDAQIMFRHILRNAMAPIIVTATLDVAVAILVEAVLSFIGVGVQPPVPSWGNMLTNAQAFMRHAWWYGTFPGLAIMLTTLSFYVAGDGLRDALDPRLKQ